MAQANDFFLYKERPLVRCGDTIYYGSMADDFVVMMQVHNHADFKDLALCSQISLKMIMTDESKNPLERIVKTSEKDSLYAALDIADVWLTSAEKKN